MKLPSVSSFLLLSLNGHAAVGSNIRGSGLDKEQDRKLGLVALEHFIASDSTKGPQLNKLPSQARASNALADEDGAHGYYKAASDMLHKDSDGVEELEPSQAATFPLDPDCREPNRLRAEVWVLPSLLDRTHDTGCPVTYRLVDSDGNNLAQDTTYHRFDGLGYEVSAWMEVDVTSVQTLEIEIGCTYVHDALLLGEVRLECMRRNLIIIPDSYSIIEKWGQYDVFSRGYCLSTDPDDWQGWERKVWDQACPNKYCFNADGFAQPCASEP